MYKDGWIASARVDRIPWKLDPAALEKLGPKGDWDPDRDKWELYNIDEDFSQANDLAARYPEKLAELKKLFWEDAEKYHVTPLFGGLASFYGFVPPTASRRTFTFYPGTENISSGMTPPIYNRSFTIASDLEVPAGGAEGVIMANGDSLGGFSLYVQGGKLHYTYSFLGLKVDTLTSSQPLPVGKVAVRYEFIAEKPGTMGTGGQGRLFINGQPVGENRLEHGVPLRFSSYAGMDIGKDNGDPVSPSYAAHSPFPFMGRIGKVVFDVAP
jgi:arylsulfatase